MSSIALINPYNMKINKENKNLSSAFILLLIRIVYKNWTILQLQVLDKNKMKELYSDEASELNWKFNVKIN